MTLFTSSSKSLTLLISIILAFEGIILLTIKKGNIDRYPPNFFEYAFLKNENRAKFILAEKLHNITKEKYNALMVGGSSGLHAIDPRIINKKPSSISLFNGSCCRNTGFDGYKYIGEILLKRSKESKILILYISPLSIPSPGGHNIKTQLADQINANYISPKRFINMIPSMRLRKRITDNLYYFSSKKNIPLDKTMTLEGWSAEELSNILYTQKGWIAFNKPRSDLNPFPGPPKDKYFSLSYIFFEELLKLNKLASNYQASLWVVFNPWPYEKTQGTINFQKDLEIFSSKYPEIHFPFKFITKWDKEYFGDDIHLNPKGAKKASLRLREVLINTKTNIPNN